MPRARAARAAHTHKSTQLNPRRGTLPQKKQIAAALRRKVYVAAAKRGVLGCIGLAPEFAALLTTDHLETNLHAVS